MSQGIVEAGDWHGMFVVFMFQSTVGGGERFQSRWMLRACSHDPGTTHCPGATH